MFVLIINSWQSCQQSRLSSLCWIWAKGFITSMQICWTRLSFVLPCAPHSSGQDPDISLPRAYDIHQLAYQYLCGVFGNWPQPHRAGSQATLIVVWKYDSWARLFDLVITSWTQNREQLYLNMPPKSFEWAPGILVGQRFLRSHLLILFIRQSNL